MEFGPITSCQIDGEKSTNNDRFYFLGLQNYCGWMTSHKIKNACSLEEKLWKNLDSILKSRDITFPTKVLIVKANIVPVVLYGCESWKIKKAE